MMTTFFVTPTPETTFITLAGTSPINEGHSDENNIYISIDVFDS